MSPATVAAAAVNLVPGIPMRALAVLEIGPPERARSCLWVASGYPEAAMSTLVIESFPEDLHARLRQTAAAHRRSVTQETIHLLAKALAAETDSRGESDAPSYWATRRLLPEFETALREGAFADGGNSTKGISNERDAR